MQGNCAGTFVAIPGVTADQGTPRARPATVYSWVAGRFPYSPLTVRSALSGGEAPFRDV